MVICMNRRNYLARPQLRDERPHRPVRSAVLVGTLALGLGGATTIFSLVHAILLAPLPYREPARVVHLGAANPTHDVPRFAVSIPDFHATIHAALGIDPSKELHEAGRPVPITDGGNPITALFD